MNVCTTSQIFRGITIPTFVFGLGLINLMPQQSDLYVYDWVMLYREDHRMCVVRPLSNKGCMMGESM